MSQSLWRHASATCLAGSLALLIGCADSHQLTRAGNQSMVRSTTGAAYVSLPQDGKLGHIAYTGSGALTAQAVAAAFAPYFEKITVGIRIEELPSAQQSAQAGGYAFLLFPEILHWEDRATEWSGRPDQMSVKVSLINSSTGEILDSAIVSGKSGLGTFGGDRPEHLLPKPLADYAATLFEKNDASKN